MSKIPPQGFKPLKKFFCSVGSEHVFGLIVKGQI